jgi:hypothetical protein
MRLNDDISRDEARARSSIALGAAFALFLTVLFGYDAKTSRAGDFFDDIFGGPAQTHQLNYDYYVPRRRAAPRDAASHAKHAKRVVGHYVEAKRQVTERRKFALVRRAP